MLSRSRGRGAARSVSESENCVKLIVGEPPVGRGHGCQDVGIKVDLV